MANFYYVKNGGTATGDAGRVATTKSTGTFASKGASAYYDSIFDANGATTPPASGDFVLCSSSHVKTYTANVVIGLRDGVTYLSVDDTELDAYLKGAKEGTANTSHDTKITVASAVQTIYSKGIDYFSSNTIVINTNVSQLSTIEDCTIELVGVSSGDFVRLVDTQDGSVLIFNSVEFKFGHAGQNLNAVAGVFVYLNKCTVNGGVTSLFKIVGSAGAVISIENSDLTGLGSTPIIAGGGSDANDDVVHISLYRCLVPDGTTFVESGVLNKNTLVDAHSIGFSSDKDSLEYFNIGNAFSGTAERELLVYRTASNPYDKLDNRLSFKFVSTANASKLAPCKVKLSDLFVDTDDYTGTVTIKVHVSIDGSAVALTNDEMWIEVYSQDGAEIALGSVVSTANNYLDAASNLTTETALWTGLSGTNKQMSISTSAITIGTSAGNISSGGVSVYLYFAKASSTAYVCPTVVVS